MNLEELNTFKSH